jgi:hypothetical protein
VSKTHLGVGGEVNSWKGYLGRVNLNATLNRQVDVLPKLYQAVLFDILRETGEFTLRGLSKISGNKAMK